MQGMETFLLNMAMDADFARALMERIAVYCKQLMGRFLAELGDNVDIIKIGDDLGTQASLMISPQMYRAILKPIHADFISFIKARTKAKVFFHSDGDVAPLIDDFIEIGVDILNPIQTSAGTMSDLPSLKKRFGKKIVFCGGIDTQRILPFGTPAQVRDEVRRVINIMGPRWRLHAWCRAYRHERCACRKCPRDGGCRVGIRPLPAATVGRCRIKGPAAGAFRCGGDGWN